MTMAGERYRWKHYRYAHGDSEGEIAKHEAITSQISVRTWWKKPSRVGAGVSILGALRVGASEPRQCTKLHGRRAVFNMIGSKKEMAPQVRSSGCRATLATR
jgi:hypothetical protein